MSPGRRAETGRGGLPRVPLRSEDGSTAEVYLHGAHVTSWVTADGTEQLYLSPDAVFDGVQPIRGGIPVIFPQFATEGPLPKHGFARAMPWDVVADGPASPASVTLELHDSAATRATWGSPFRARLHVRLSRGRLETELRVRNQGHEVLRFTTALHTYLRTPAGGTASIVGLEGCAYRGATGAGEPVVQQGPLVIAGGINRVYLGVPPLLLVGLADRTIEVRTAGLPDAVVWNPGEGAGELDDMPADDARRMLCVEPAAVGRPIAVPPGREWRGSQRLGVRHM